MINPLGHARALLPAIIRASVSVNYVQFSPRPTFALPREVQVVNGTEELRRLSARAGLSLSVYSWSVGKSTHWPGQFSSLKTRFLSGTILDRLRERSEA